MLFNTLQYALFFAVVFGVSWLLLGFARVRLLFLLGASYFFYACWDYRFLPLIWASSTADFLLARAIHDARNERSRKLWLVFTVVMNLGVLGFFKYWNFGIENVAAALGLDPASITLRVALPIGVSFFTFESMSYVIDVYRRELEPTDSYAEYLTFVAFFPHLVAGPIVRPRDLLPQLAKAPRFSTQLASEGLFLVAVGLLKKIVVGDYLALNLVDRVFDAPAMYSAVEVYAGVVGYALQIYCDFSGYTDIAIGSALLLGVRFPRNFDSPYQSTDLAEFWRRWHISLSSWLRDYLYIPLGGNRHGRVRTYVNLLLTMVLGGLWHGAAWTFVVWGTLHGLGLAVHRAFREWSDRRRPARPTSLGAKLFGWVLTFHFVCAAWIYFRAATFDRASLVFSRLGSLTTHHQNLPPALLGVLALGLATHFLPQRWLDTTREQFGRAPAWAQGLALFAVAVALREMAASDAVPFVYFQF
ncbi:MAG TPA: MBOAT family protein [Polyangiaceae bacterium]|nr:MBOAT family protein [Polyangiaceae bacterium]